MRIVVNHLTRMHGGHICVAGVDLDSGRHVRPLLGHQHLPFYFLERYGGPFEMAGIVDLGAARPTPDPPHVEDHVFVPSRAKLWRSASSAEFWDLLDGLAKPTLQGIFGDALRAIGRSRCGTDVGKGLASLGCLRPQRPPDLYLATGRDGKPQVRMRLNDGELEADTGVTDLRLREANHTTPDREKVQAVARRIHGSDDVILSLGLTRKYRPSQQADYFHYLQVNNVHLKEEPTWQLG
ncbi:MAG: dual OB domain-containing protein [Planctomycetota bacterium]|jgi:hypothetical protein